MKLEDLQVYSLAMELADDIWQKIKDWDYLSKDTIGKQLIRSSDSVAANISEGYGRFHYKDSKRFYYFSRTSLYESKTWLNKAYQRGLISKEEYHDFETRIRNLSVKLNNYIKMTKA